MLEWRTRMKVRRRARRRYLALAYQRWRAGGVPTRVLSHSSQILVTLAWLLVPGVLALAFATLLWLAQDSCRPSELRPALGAVAVPVLVVLLLRGTLRG